MLFFIFGQLHVFVCILSGWCVDFEPSRNMVTSNFEKICTTFPKIYNSTDVFKSKYQRKFKFWLFINNDDCAVKQCIQKNHSYNRISSSCLHVFYETFIIHDLFPWIMFWEGYMRSFSKSWNKRSVSNVFQTHVKLIIFKFNIQ